MPYKDVSYNFSELGFPTDTLSISDLRKRFPQYFDLGIGFDKNRQPRFFFDESIAEYSANQLANAIRTERQLAAAVITARKIGSSMTEKDSLMSALADYYTNIGLATGKCHAQELVKTFVNTLETTLRTRNR